MHKNALRVRKPRQKYTAIYIEHTNMRNKTRKLLAHFTIKYIRRTRMECVNFLLKTIRFLWWAVKVVDRVTRAVSALAYRNAIVINHLAADDGCPYYYGIEDDLFPIMKLGEFPERKPNEKLLCQNSGSRDVNDARRNVTIKIYF